MELIESLSILGFAISGSVIAAKKGLDWFGIGFMGFITALGGGTVRDLILGLPPTWLHSLTVILWVMAGIAITIVAYTWVLRMHRTLALFDTIGISLAAVAGTSKSLEAGVNPIAAIFLGVVSCVLGGILRDTFCNVVPMIFKRELYATACMAGGGVLVIFHTFQYNSDLGYWLAALTVFVIRIFAIKFQIGLPNLNMTEH